MGTLITPKTEVVVVLNEKAFRALGIGLVIGVLGV